jgi:hypothetical protein
MPDAPTPPASIEEAIARVTRFREARDWDQYHTPRREPEKDRLECFH